MKYLKDYTDIVTKTKQAWGKQRLLDIVSDSLRSKFLQAEEKFEKMRMSLTGEKHQKLYEAMTRGWMALVSEAKDLGYEPIKPLTWVAEVKGKTIIVVNQDWAFNGVHHQYANEPDTYVITLSNLLEIASMDLIKFQAELGMIGEPSIKTKPLKKK